MSTYCTAVLDDCVLETRAALRPQLLAIGATEDHGFLQEPTVLVSVGHNVLAVERDVLMRLFG